MADEVIPNDKWFVEHPISIYNEDVKSLARENKLKIVDIKFINEPIGQFAAKDVPKLTLVSESKFAGYEGSKPIEPFDEKEEKRLELEKKYSKDEPKPTKKKSVKKSSKKKSVKKVVKD